MDLFLSKKGTFSYDNETDGGEKVPLKYKHYVKIWEQKPLPKANTDFWIDGRTSWIAPSSLHGICIFYILGWFKHSTQ